MNLKKQIENRYSVFSMANLATKTTGVQNAIIWVSVGETDGKKSTHGPRIKVVEGTNMTSAGLTMATVITISGNPEVKRAGKIKNNIVKDAILFVKQNKDTLLDYWNGQIDTAELIQRIRPI